MSVIYLFFFSIIHIKLFSSFFLQSLPKRWSYDNFCIFFCCNSLQDIYIYNFQYNLEKAVITYCSYLFTYSAKHTCRAIQLLLSLVSQNLFIILQIVNDHTINFKSVRIPSSLPTINSLIDLRQTDFTRYPYLHPFINCDFVSMSSYPMVKTETPSLKKPTILLSMITTLSQGEFENSCRVNE